MCGLCGLFGGADHWTATSASPQIFGDARTRRAERAERVRLANAVLGGFALRLDDWQGSTFILSSATGRREMAGTLPAVWKAGAGVVVRPVDPVLLSRLAGSRP